ncbi:hypothetical protein RIF29_16985 [Crotalaria pallida]|uniref:BHLH domain-containing protein n=1 Tax=Crotalaria pallida TaxID=3830 RepID=A0AAN9IEX9_CROPI
MPLPDDRSPKRGEELVPPEAVLLVNPVEPEFKGEVDDKYQYSNENKDLKVHGWISSKSETDPPMGFWGELVKCPAATARIGLKNEAKALAALKNHSEAERRRRERINGHFATLRGLVPSTEKMFLSAHYAGEDIVLKLQPNEPWKKVFGPTFFYLNKTLLDSEDPLDLWEDAKYQMTKEVQSWPYDFPASEDFQKSNQRGSVSGTLLVRDRCLFDEDIFAEGAYIGLAPPGDAGSWQRECKGYQFWTRADFEGNFSIDNIRSGDYNLYAWVPGFIGEYWSNVVLTITPDPNPKYINKLYVNHPDKFRQYGLWERYADLYPNEDLIYTVGVSDFSQDWFFAQVTRKNDDGSYRGTTWQIKFDLDEVKASGIYKLRLALASAHFAELQVRVNDQKQNPPLFTTGVIGKDYAIARHGIHGLYWLFNIDVPGLLLKEKDNTIHLTQTIATDPLAPFHGIMYDYIRLEAPNPSLPE